MGGAVTVAQPAAIRRKVEAWLSDQDDDAPALALRGEPVWKEEQTLTIGGTPVRIVPCRTPLAARAALLDRNDGERVVLLTELSDNDLGDGLLAHLSKHHVRTVQPWDVVVEMFEASAIDPSLAGLGRWVADALIDHVPADEWPPAPSAVLTRDHALRSLVAELFGLDRNEIDSAGFMEWSTDAGRVLRLSKLAPEVIAGLTKYLADTAGPAVVPIMAAARAGNGVDAVPLGLLSGVLWPGPTGTAAATAVAVSRARLEPWFGGMKLEEAQATAFAAAAEAWVDRVMGGGEAGAEANRMLARAETIAADVEATPLLGGSALLPSGFVHRLRDVAAAVRMAVPTTGVTAESGIAAAQKALARLSEHRGGDLDRLKTMQMAVRLLRWLATPDPEPATLYDALQRQVHDDGWADRARLDVFAGDADPQTAEALHLLHQAVDARRARHDRRFADLLAAATQGEQDPGRLILVEDVLDRVVQPILDQGRQVLLLVMDGMSMAAATELAESLTRAATWTELTLDGGPRVGVLAALPTITEVSRCSLFSGRIAVGSQNAELQAFRERYPTGVLLHKSKLRGQAGVAIAPDVATALADSSTPLVAAVVNTIDDALDRSEPGTAVWGSDTIPGVRDLLTLAAGRVVVIVSDHGHVVDRGLEAVYRPSPSSENRWRPADPPPADGEMLYRGSRVAKGDGAVVLPWREELRYGPRKAGYHGGASQAEVVIPLLVLTDGDDSAISGWGAAPVPSPAWWRESLAVETPTAAPAKRSPSRKPKAQTESLFDLEAPAPAKTADIAKPADDFVAGLLASDVYKQRRDPRAPLPDERAAALLRTLVANGDRATMDTLAARAQIPAGRILGVVTALRKILQVEGYPVLTVDPDGVTVKLDRGLLIDQFHLKAS
ncbi:BREX-2 system phosphatase PglZ [Actinoplanes sp. TBRC 11911]|uniref:BREX-2 system phosphatase PglZ n=1 Tax=Actinoplanes sp. TBRC 11911 TaxID=2729386 RepID=UPI00145E6733|nr:BREX-2 system phosphatase PglZ [Actinoplanes sp. TBRC 11911]NMO57590.1 BREX-2 system phosphatase PglZ [Actinoplanes sp. TBRC 11911]